jgi:nucleotide-binding universal stress UspA family protein
MNIQEIVFPVDFSARCVLACPYAAALAHRLQAKLTLLHVVEGIPLGSSPLDRLYTEDQAVTEQRKQAAGAALEAFQQQYMPRGEYQRCVLVGEPAQAIVDYAGERDDRLILMPTSGYGPFRRMLLGSVAAKVLHDAKCPVLTGPHLEKGVHPTEWFELRRILCAVSLDWETDAVLKAAASFATRLSAQLKVVHVVTPVEEGLLPLMDPGAPPLSTDAVEGAIKDALARTGTSAEVQVCVGEVSRQVAGAAKTYHADLVVMGRGGAPELPGRLGSHGYAIVRRSPCPVLCV